MGSEYVGRHRASEQAGEPLSGPISDRLRADSEALARHGAEEQVDPPGGTRN